MVPYLLQLMQTIFQEKERHFFHHQQVDHQLIKILIQMILYLVMIHLKVQVQNRDEEGQWTEGLGGDEKDHDQETECREKGQNLEIDQLRQLDCQEETDRDHMMMIQMTCQIKGQNPEIEQNRLHGYQEKTGQDQEMIQQVTVVIAVITQVVLTVLNQYTGQDHEMIDQQVRPNHGLTKHLYQ